MNENRLLRTLTTYTVFAIAMAYLESAIVVYLRMIYYPGGFHFPLILVPGNIAALEIGREVATIIMLWFITRMHSDQFKKQFALFLYSFGVWDIFYYVWLKVFLGWPASWLEWDILFLIPWPWIGPWLAPALVSVCFIIVALIVLRKPECFRDRILNGREWVLVLLGAALILGSFFWETAAVLHGAVPQSYPWWLFFAGLLGGCAVFRRRFRMGTGN